MIPQPKGIYQKDLEKHNEQLFYTKTFSEFMIIYLRLYKETNNQEYLDMYSFINNNKAKIYGN